MTFIDKALGVHPQALALLSQRSGLLAANIANANTPGYKARDINFADTLKMAQQQSGVKLEPTSARHIGAGHQQQGEALYRIPTREMSNGNSVETEVEQSAYAENALRYQASLEFIGGTFSGLKKAFKGE